MIVYYDCNRKIWTGESTDEMKRIVLDALDEEAQTLDTPSPFSFIRAELKGDEVHLECSSTTRVTKRYLLESSGLICPSCKNTTSFRLFSDAQIVVHVEIGKEDQTEILSRPIANEIICGDCDYTNAPIAFGRNTTRR